MVVLLSISTIIQFTERSWIYRKNVFTDWMALKETILSRTRWLWAVNCGQSHLRRKRPGCEWITVHAVYGLYQQISWPKWLTVTANPSQTVSMWKVFQDWSQNWNLYGVATRVWTELLIVVLGHHSCGTDNHPLHPNQVLAWLCPVVGNDDSMFTSCILT